MRYAKILTLIFIVLPTVSFGAETKASRKPAEAPGSYYCNGGYDALIDVKEQMDFGCNRAKPFQVFTTSDPKFKFFFCCIYKDN